MLKKKGGRGRLRSPIIEKRNVTLERLNSPKVAQEEKDRNAKTLSYHSKAGRGWELEEAEN